MIFKKNKGFTLIEVIISIAIIAIIGVILTNFVSTTIKARNISIERLQLLASCTSYMNEIKSVQESFSSVSDIEDLLEAMDFEKGTTVFKKVESTNINIKITINRNMDVPGLYEIMIVGTSPNVNDISISSVIKGGGLD
jgi:prepilin-type N-terminal cleavage/methylation domain-containing protein